MQEENTKSAELPLYQSIKQVRAATILRMYAAPTEQGELKTRFILETDCGIIMVDNLYMDKHQPKLGGYYVKYEDGYESWSPADTFSKGNVKLTGNESDFLMMAEKQMREAFGIECDAEMIRNQSVDNLTLAVKIGQLEANDKFEAPQAIHEDLYNLKIICATYGSRITEYLSRVRSILQNLQEDLTKPS
jgi:hypothetical protein